ncbi:Sec-independent protein translocase subunit TatA [Mycobacterium sp. C31M]
MGAVQPWHWLIVIIAFILLFGAKKLPDAARSLGKSMRIFKSEIKEMQSDGADKPSTQLPEAPTSTPAPATPVASERVETPEQSSDKRPA